MPLSELLGDPVLGYTLLAAALLAAASLAAGIARLDFLALTAPSALLAILVCLLVATSLRLLLGPAVASEDAAWTPVGFERFPLALPALAYGPTVGLATAGIFSLLVLLAGEPVGAGEILLALELLLLGWLAIFPSPRRHRWAAAANFLLATLLTSLTAGVATARLLHGDVLPFAVWHQIPVSLSSLTTTTALLLLLPASVYQYAFRGSMIEPAPADPPETDEGDGTTGEAAEPAG